MPCTFDRSRGLATRACPHSMISGNVKMGTGPQGQSPMLMLFRFGLALLRALFVHNPRRDFLFPSGITAFLLELLFNFLVLVLALGAGSGWHDALLHLNELPA